MSAEETKVNSAALGGTGASTASTARSNLGAAASGANTDITSITGSAATLTTPRTVQTNLASTAAASFNGSANISPGVAGTLPLGNGGTGSTTAAGARTSLGAAASGANTDITSITGSAATLTTARTIQTNLASTSAASFNGSANVSPGITGTLPVANGGTGVTTLAALSTALGFAYSSNRFTIPIGGTNYYIIAARQVVTTDGSGAATVTFPVAFPTQCLTVVVTNGNNPNNNSDGLLKLIAFNPATSLASFNLIAVNQLSVSVAVNYIAIGY